MKNVEAKELFKTLGQNVKYYRKLYNLKKGKLTQEKLAEEVDVCTALIGNLESENIDVTELGVKSGAVAGIYDASAELTNLFAYTGTAYSGKEDEIWSAIHNQVGTIRYYAQGANYYYAARIRHFNDDETDWNNGETYGIQHLGRYGVVRNNWYEVKINKITGPGEPVIVKPDDGANDEAEGYIRAEINVLSWAKRSQGVEL